MAVTVRAAWVAIGLFLFMTVSAGGTVAIVQYQHRRGIRNNNPGNIRHGDNWQGMSETQTDDSFVQFQTPEFGIRAMSIILKNYRQKYGLNTVRQIISRWAPPNENDTQSYINAVCDAVGVDENEKLDDSDMGWLIAAIIKHENGVQPYSIAQINQGVQLAGLQWGIA